MQSRIAGPISDPFPDIRLGLLSLMGSAVKNALRQVTYVTISATCLHVLPASEEMNMLISFSVSSEPIFPEATMIPGAVSRLAIFPVVYGFSDTFRCRCKEQYGIKMDSSMSS